MLTLSQALRLAPHPAVAFVGAGGKTTALFELARQQRPSVVTTTTHLAGWQAAWADHHTVWAARVPSPPIDLRTAPPVTLLTGPINPSGRLTGLHFRQLEVLQSLAEACERGLFVEADGAKLRPLKAPAAHEPAVPPCVTTVVVTAGLSSLGQPLDEAHVHRPSVFAALSGCRLDEPITGASVVQMLTHAAGGLKNIPAAARRIVLLNQADTAELACAAWALADALLSAYHLVLVASHSGVARGAPTASDAAAPSVLAARYRIAGIVLAAGGASRFGAPKQVLDYRGRPFVRAVAETAAASHLSPVIVVTGACHDQVAAALRGLPVILAHNPEWPAGLSTSVRVGVNALAPFTGAAVFLPADQPRVSAAVIGSLTERHATTLAPIVAPIVGDRRVSPALFDRAMFPDLSGLAGDVGGGALFATHPVEAVVCTDDGLLLDVDTPADYRRLVDAP